MIISNPWTDTETIVQRWMAFWNSTLGFGLATSITSRIPKAIPRWLLLNGYPGWVAGSLVLFLTIPDSPTLTKLLLLFYKLLLDLDSFLISHQSWALWDPWAHRQWTHQWGELQLPGQRGIPVRRWLPPDRHVRAHLPAGSPLVGQDPFLCA